MSLVVLMMYISGVSGCICYVFVVMIRLRSSLLWHAPFGESSEGGMERMELKCSFLFPLQSRHEVCTWVVAVAFP